MSTSRSTTEPFGGGLASQFPLRKFDKRVLKCYYKKYIITATNNFINKILRNQIASFINNVSSAFNWPRCVKSPTAMMSPMLNIGGLIAGSRSKSMVLGVLHVSRFISRLYRKAGMKGLSLYLKASSQYLFAAQSGNPIKDPTVFGTRVKLNGGGIPVFVPVIWRRKMKLPCWEFTLILSFCGLYRVLNVPGKFTIKTIVEPGISISANVLQKAKEFGSTLPIWERRLPWKPSPMLSSGPASAEFRRKFKISLNSQARTGSYAAVLLKYNQKVVANMLTLSVHLRLKSQLGNILDIGKEILKSFPNYPEIPIGKLATKEEPNKVRVFAIVDPITQWLLQPLHRHLFSILKTKFKGVDATFDQTSGVQQAEERILKEKPSKVFSFDLSAATDRLPLSIQIAILNGLKDGLGDAWGSVLVDRSYELPSKYKHFKENKIKYAVGQPMGALSSWAMLAVTHHFVVNEAVRLALEDKSLVLRGNDRFTQYMVLGDDIIIWNEAVANHYYKFMTQTLGVKINLTKSLISKIGVFEFAKRLVHPGFGIISAVPLKEFSLVSANIAVLATLFQNFRKSVRISSIFRIFGFNYKVLGKLSNLNLNSRAGFVLNWAMMPSISDKSSPSWGAWFHQMKLNPNTPLSYVNSDLIIIEALCALIIKGYFDNYKQDRLNTAEIFNYDLVINKKYNSIFENDDFVNRTDFALGIVYTNVLAKALVERKYFDILENEGIPINELGINRLVDLLLKMPTVSLVLSEELFTPNGAVLKLEPIIQRIVVNKLIQVKLDPNKFSKRLATLEWNHSTESMETPWDVQFISAQKSLPLDITAPKIDQEIKKPSVKPEVIEIIEID